MTASEGRVRESSGRDRRPVSCSSRGRRAPAPGTRYPALEALLWLVLATAGCRPGGLAARPGESAIGQNDRASGFPQEMLLAHTDQPAFFLSAQPDAAIVGFGSDELAVKLEGSPAGDRVRVRVEGPLEVTAFVPKELLMLRVQRRGQVRGTPVYLAPNHAVQVLGNADAKGRLRVRAAATVMGESLEPMEGTFPSSGLAARPAPESAQQPAEGQAKLVPANRELRLLDRPHGTLTVVVPGKPAPWAIRALGQRDGFTAVRAGEGPFLVGYTDLSLAPAPTPTSHAAPPVHAKKPKATGGAVPARLLRETGPLRRVKRGARLRFDGQDIATFHAAGYARVLARYPNGELDVFAAVDDTVALRGLLRHDDLTSLSAH